MLRRIFSSAVTAYVIMFGFFLASQYVVHRAEQQDVKRNKDAISQIVAERDEARITSCLQYNLTQKVQIHAEVEQSHDFVLALVDGSTNPATVARAKAFNTKHDVLIKGEHAPRNCTPKGIQKYLANPNN